MNKPDFIDVGSYRCPSCKGVCRRCWMISQARFHWVGPYCSHTCAKRELNRRATERIKQALEIVRLRPLEASK